MNPPFSFRGKLARSLAPAFVLGSLALACGFASARDAEGFAVASPSGLLTGTISVDPSGHLSYTVMARGQPVLLPSPLGITVNGQDLGQDARLVAVDTRESRETYPVTGVHARAVNQYHEASVQFTGGPSHTPWTLQVRAFDDGLAYRYIVPGNDRADRTINGEATGWRFPAGGTIWFQDGRDPAYESVFATAPLDTLPHDRAIDFHGAVKPSGRERTWPNELTREGIHGREQGQRPGVHDTTLPFTRNVQGHADFTPVDWREKELKDGSWAHGLERSCSPAAPSGKPPPSRAPKVVSGSSRS